MKPSEVIEVLNDLVEINNDRVEGYRRAINETSDLDADLKTLFEGYAINSEGYKTALAQKILQLKSDAEVEAGTTASGKLYRMWMDMKATFSGETRETVLESCEFGEDAAQKAYKEALEYSEMPGDIRSLITEQKASLRQAHDHIKGLRDRQRAMNS